MNPNVSLEEFDNWLKDGSSAAALVMRQWLMPVEGKDAAIFPPTYAKPTEMKDTEWPGYNIDRLSDGSTVCQIDSVGSQANHMEPIFKRGDYIDLVPQITVTLDDNKVNLLDAGHRAADAVVRFSGLRSDLEKAFRSIRENGNAEPLAKIAPTSIVFGSWDSRSTEVKLPRIVRSVIRAFKVDLLHRSAQYIPPIRYVNAGVIDEPKTDSEGEALSQEGLRDNPASWKHGGVILKPDGEIRREAALNLSAIRALMAEGDGADEKTMNLRRYVLGLALVAFTAPQDTFLREGCQLVPDIDHPPASSEWKAVLHTGQREPVEISHETALKYARIAAKAFGVGENRETVFDKKYTQEHLSKSKDERKAANKRQRKPATEEKSE